MEITVLVQVEGEGVDTSWVQMQQKLGFIFNRTLFFFSSDEIILYHSNVHDDYLFSREFLAPIDGRVLSDHSVVVIGDLSVALTNKVRGLEGSQPVKL